MAYSPLPARRLLRRAVVASTREGELLFDPFCGSGTSGVASKELGRFFVGSEMEREYAELAARRIGAAERGVTLGEIRAVGRGGGWVDEDPRDDG